MKMFYFAISVVLIHGTCFVLVSCDKHKISLKHLGLSAIRSAHVLKNIRNSMSRGSTEDPSLSKICNENAYRRKRTLSRRQKIETTTYALPPEYAHLSEEFINCGHLTFPPECYIKLENTSVYVTPYDRVLNRSNYLITNGILYICPKFYPPYEEENKFPASIHTMATICITISTTCIILHMIMFAFIKRLQNLPGCCLLSLCVALLIGYISSYVIELQLNDCKVAGMFLYYGFLSSFFWMNIISYDVWTAIKMAVDKLRLSSTRSFLKRFVMYSVYGWISPLAIFLIAFIVDQTTTRVEFKFIFLPEFCWFQYKTALALYFVMPICLLLILNICLFASTYRMFRKTTSIQEQPDVMPRFFLSLRLASVMGVMWIIGIVAVVAQVRWLWYLHSACNALQGLFIFFSFDFNEKTWRECKSIIRKKKTSEMPLNERKKSYANNF